MGVTMKSVGLSYQWLQVGFVFFFNENMFLSNFNTNLKHVQGGTLKKIITQLKVFPNPLQIYSLNS